MTRKLMDTLATIIEQWVPPIVRDSRWFSRLLLRFSVGNLSHHFLTFKEIAPSLTPAELSAKYYDQIKQAHLTDTTDLSQTCLDLILKNLKGHSILEAGCGRGFLAKQIVQQGDYQVTATDIMIENVLVKSSKNLRFKQANMQALPFRNKSFDTVVTTHTLEHVLDLQQAIKELRRVAKKRLIIVVPRERPYRYPPNFHLHFFPYAHSFIIAIGYHPRGFCQEINRELYYQEDAS